jgi:hypothetical protein
MTPDQSNPFPPDALETNRAGAVTDAQRRHLVAASRSIRKSALGDVSIALVVAAISVLGAARVVQVKPGLSAAPAVFVAVVLIAIVIFMIGRSLVSSGALARDLSRVQVQSIEGAIGRRMGSYTSTRSAVRPRYLDVGDQNFRVSRDMYDAAPDAGFVRVYFLPASRRVVNLERLPDRPFTASTQDVAQSVLAAVRSHSRSPINELRASAAGLERSMKAGLGDAPSPPPQAERDPRPLGQAILGTWSNGFVTVAFSPDGSVTTTMMGGRQQHGRWSVDGSGRLHSDVTGRQGVADAWVVGDQLTISADGARLTFTRRD